MSEGRPNFARGFPEGVAELDALVAAFADGDYRRVRDEAPALAAKADDPAVRRAAEELAARTRPDQAIVWLIAITGALLVFLTVWWVVHAHEAPPSTAPAVEHVR